MLYFIISLRVSNNVVTRALQVQVENLHHIFLRNKLHFYERFGHLFVVACVHVDVQSVLYSAQSAPSR